MPNYSSYFSNDRFWSKLSAKAQAIGLDLAYSALVLYYALQDPNVPAWARGKI